MPPENSSLPKKDNESALQTSGPVLSTAKSLDEEKISQHINGASPFGEPEKSNYTPNPNLKTLRSYQSDLEETIGKKKESVVSIIAAEQRPEKKTVLNIPDSKDKKYFFKPWCDAAFRTNIIRCWRRNAVYYLLLWLNC